MGSAFLGGRLKDDEEKVYCPDCGRPVRKGQRFCKFCGADLTRASGSVSEPEALGTPARQDEEWFGFFGRLHRFVTSPSEAMRDVALAPDYGGVFAILLAEVVLAGVTLALVLQKIQFVGSYAGQVSALLFSVLALGVILSLVPLIVRWLMKSFLVRFLCGARSGWSFRTAAVITGYAYFADVVVALIGLLVGWFLIPSVVIDTSNLNAAEQSLAQYFANNTWLAFFFTLPVALAGLLWKSYLGGLGAYHGTGRRCTIGRGFVVFLALGFVGIFIGLLISLLTSTPLV